MAGWGTVVVAAPVLGVALVPDAGPDRLDPAGALAAVAIAGSVGMLVGGVVAVLLLRRATGRSATTGLARTAAVVVVGGAVGAVLGRWVVDAVTSLAGHGAVTAIGAAAGGGIIAALVVLGAMLGLDRATLRDFRRLESQPRPPVEDRVPDPANPDGPLV